MDLIYEQKDWQLRLAKASDNEGLCHLFKDVNMDSDLVLTEERDPDFFALRNLHSGKPYTVVLEDKNAPSGSVARIAGSCSAVIREGWVNGELKKIGYICDLRVADKFRRGQVFPQCIDIFVRYVTGQEEVDIFYFSIMRTNQSAQHAKKLANAINVTPYNMVNIQVMKKSLPVETTVSRASAQDKEELVEFLKSAASKRTFGFNFDEAMMNFRITNWPEFDIENFFILRNQPGEIVATAAPWDNSNSLRRSRVHGYNGNMKLIRKGFDLEAKLRGHSPMPKLGECFNLLSLTHFEVKDDNPVYTNQLLRGIYNQYCGSKYHFIAAFIPEGSALEKSFKGFRTQKVPMDLYAFTGGITPLQPETCINKAPGFEMALH